MFHVTTVRGRAIVPLAWSLVVAVVPYSTASAADGIPGGSGAVVTASPLDGVVVLYQEAAPEGVTGDWVAPQTADPPVAELAATDQGVAPASPEMPVDPAPTADVATDPWVDEAPGKQTGSVDPATGEWVDPTTVKSVEPAPVAAAPVNPAPGLEPAPVDTSVSRGTEPWGQPIATAYITGTSSDGAPCHAAPDWGTEMLAVLGEGEPVEVRAETVGEWQPVNCAGVGGYVPIALIAWTPAAPVPVAAVGGQPGGTTGAGGTGIGGEQIVSFAIQYQGYPYVYAGEGPYAFDCSGFTMFVIRNTLGLDVPHDMVVQYDMGQPVSRDALQPGDLVFFANTIHPGMSHNGIYIGGGQFLHAETESSGVTVSDLNDDYYSSRWYGAVRFS